MHKRNLSYKSYVFSDIFFYLKICRKPLFYKVNLIIPCVGIFYLSILVFYLPAQSGEKTALAIAILVSQTLYFTLVIEVIPATSLTLPLLGCYLLFSMVLVAVSVCLATIVLNLHYRKPSTHRMPTWVRNVLIHSENAWNSNNASSKTGRLATEKLKSCCFLV